MPITSSALGAMPPSSMQTFVNYSYCIDHLLKEINVTLNLNLNLNLRGCIENQHESKPVCEARSLETFLTYPMHQVRDDVIDPIGPVGQECRKV